ncbi:hypothetical protein D3C75_951360 [compost metagenome]
MARTSAWRKGARFWNTVSGTHSRSVAISIWLVVSWRKSRPPVSLRVPSNRSSRLRLSLPPYLSDSFCDWSNRVPTGAIAGSWKLARMLPP